jgi:SAM-dependent methyltransferase
LGKKVAGQVRRSCYRRQTSQPDFENGFEGNLPATVPVDHKTKGKDMRAILTEEKNEAVRGKVREGYAKIAEETSAGCCGPGVSCCGSAPQDADKLARELGYTVDELKALPDGANMGLSCGNPAALAALKPGEVVLDLGSGGGFDVFIAGRKVGASGRAIGVDMTAEMIAKARRNAATYRKDTGLDNVEFRVGEIEHLPVADNSVDAIISNCVINLSPDKPQVWREIARVLKPGGRVAVSDIALLKPLPPEILKMVKALVGCVAGAALAGDTERFAREAGLTDIVLKSKTGYIEAMTSWEDPLYKKIVEHLPAGTKPSDYIVSLEVQARKAGGECCGSDCCGA